MENKILSINSSLNNVNFQTFEDSNKEVKILLTDRINEINIIDEKISCIVSRKLNIAPILEVYVDFNVNIMTNKKINKDDFVLMIKENIKILSNIFAKISVVIANLTNMSDIGPLVTIPNSNENKIIFE